MTLSRASRLPLAACVLLLALALALAGRAHAVPRAAGPDDTAIAAFLASGGQAGDLCGSLAPDAQAEKDCPVCRMPADLPLPARAAPGHGAVATALDAVAPQPLRAAPARHPAWDGRAPPRA